MFFSCAVALQAWILTECIVRRLLCVMFGVRHSAVTEYADRSVIAQCGALLLRAGMTPVRAAAAVLGSPVSLVVMTAALAVVLAAVAQAGPPLLHAFAAVWNASIGPAVAQVLDISELVGAATRQVLPFYNAMVYFVEEFVVQVLGELVWSHAASVPELLSSLALACLALGQSLVTYFANIVGCFSAGEAACETAGACGAALVSVDVRCVASSTHLSIDLMTPGMYLQKAFDIVGSVTAATCSRVAAPVRIGVYPLLDYNLYKAVHLAVNVPFSSVRVAVNTVKRCSLVSSIAEFPAEARAVACAPDVAPTFAMAAEAVRALGKLGDAWLDYAIEETAIAAGGEPTCSRLAALNVRDLSAKVQSILAADGRVPRFRIVSVFNGDSNDNLVLTTGADAIGRQVGRADVYSFQLWPFEIDVRMGVASVETASGPGLLGCRCVDGSDAAGELLRLECASVPLDRNGADSGEAFARATVHAVTLPGRGMTCARTLVRVNSLRFSRRRAGGRDAAGGLPGLEEGIQRQTLAADAAIVVQPWCGLGFCSLLACYPFCMGLHAAGVGAQNITLRAEREWDEFVSIRQSDCAVTVDDGRCAGGTGTLQALVETPDGVSTRGRCGVRCVAEDTANSFVPVGAYSTAVSNLTEFKARAYPGVRLAAQPFVVAGDVFLTEATAADGAEEVVITRLYDNGRGAFALAAEELTMLSHRRGVPVTSCAVQTDRQCVAAAARQGALPREAALRAYFYLPQDEQPTLPAVASPSAVHWAANPAKEVYGEFFAFCNSGAAAFNYIVHSSYGRARVWTLQLGDLEAAATVAYMPVPGFFDGSRLECDTLANLEIVALEFVDPSNVLVTVLAARPRDYDPARGLCWRGGDDPTYDSTCSPEYRYYWLNPRRHDCLAAEEAGGATFSCWRDVEAGKWPDDRFPPLAAAAGLLCPAAQRAPPVFSLVGETAALGVLLAQLAAETMVVVPRAAVAGAAAGGSGLAVLWTPALGRSTFHSLLDSGGAQFLAVEPIIASYRSLAHKGAQTLTKAFALLRGQPVYATLAPVVAGTAVILEHSPASVVLTAGLARQLRAVRALPVGPAAGAGASAAVSTLPLGVASLATVMLAGTDFVSASLRAGRRLALRILQKGAFTSVVSAVLYDSGPESRSVLDAVRVQCHALAGIARGGALAGESATENALSGFVRHMCLLGPDAVEGLVTAVSVLVSEYPAVTCLCAADGGGAGLSSPQLTAFDSDANACLTRGIPLPLKVWSLRLLDAREAPDREALCFAAMDGANQRLETAFDAVLRRVYRASTHAADAFEFFVAFFRVDRESCNSYLLSPYVVSFVPEPVDYFMTCLHTPDCRVRCADEYAAFDAALALAGGADAAPLGAETSAGGTFAADIGAAPGAGPASQPLAVTRTLTVDVESPIFDPKDSETSSDLPPFALMGVEEIVPASCEAMCGDAAQTRCFVVSGLAAADNAARTRPAVAYYCLPLDIRGYLARAALDAADYSPAPGAVIDARPLTTYKAPAGREWLLLVTAGEDGGGGLKPPSLHIALPGLSTRVVRGTLHSMRRIRVRPASAAGARARVVVHGGMWSIDAAQASAAELRARRMRPACMAFEIGTSDAEESTLVFQWQACDADEPPGLALCLREDAGACETELWMPEASDAATLRTGTHTQEVSAPGLRELLGDVGEQYAFADGLAERTTMVSYGVHGPAQTATLRNRAGAGDVWDVIALNAAGSHKSWVQVATIDLRDNVASATFERGLHVPTDVLLAVGCSLEACTACAGGGEALVARCQAAQMCGVERCAGTVVHMSKPLCSMGSLFAKQLDIAQATLGVLWRALAQTVARTVEISHNRRLRYEIAWPEEAFATAACHAKDVSVQASASLTSFLGGMLRERQRKQIDDVAARGAVLDTRVHARSILTLMAVTDLMASILNWVVYAALALRKVMLCAVNDGLVLVQNTQRAAGIKTVLLEVRAERLSDGADLYDSLRPEDQTCLSSRELSKVTNPDSDADLTETLSVLFMSWVNLAGSTVLEALKQVLDAALAWLYGVVSSLSDLAQTADPDACKTSRVDYVGVAQCACGDTAHRIPAARKAPQGAQGAVADGAWWCSGFLALTAPDGQDIVVWNPFSLAELLAFQDVDAYLTCLRDEPAASCRARKPESSARVLERQGVDLLQVITRCRENFQRARWDDGALLWGLFTTAEWTQRALAVGLDELSGLRRRVRTLHRTFELQQAALSVSDAVRGCLRTAVESNDLLHSCESLALQERGRLTAAARAAYYAYEAAPVDSFSERDACRSFSGGAAGSESGRNPTIWAPGSANRVPVARMHDVRVLEPERRATAEAALRALTAQIRAALAEVAGLAGLEDQLDVEAWSVEGDDLHQLVDCILLGPYAAAETTPAATVGEGARLRRAPAALYHRGDPLSRAFAARGATGGSPARRRIMQYVLAKVSSEGVQNIAQQAREQVDRIREAFLGGVTAAAGIPPGAFVCHVICHLSLCFIVYSFCQSGSTR